MTFTNNGINNIRDLFNTALTDAELGTGTTASLNSDTSLETRDATTDISVNNTVSDKQVTTDYNLPATTGNGTDFTEFGAFDTNDVMFNRQVFAALTKESTEQWQISIVYKFN